MKNFFKKLNQSVSSKGDQMQNCKIINAIAYQAYVEKWLESLNNNQYYYINKALIKEGGLNANTNRQIIQGFHFDNETIVSLISSIGVQTINVHFCITYPDVILNAKSFIPPYPQVNIVLFGTDSLGCRCSAYYLGAPYYDRNIPSLNLNPINPNTPTNSIPGKLAWDWIETWRYIKFPFTTFNIFTTPYGFLQGYNYGLKDFISALFPYNTAVNYAVDVCLAAHKHHFLKPGEVFVGQKKTLGLVLYSQPLIIESTICEAKFYPSEINSLENFYEADFSESYDNGKVYVMTFTKFSGLSKIQKAIFSIFEESEHVSNSNNFDYNVAFTKIWDACFYKSDGTIEEGIYKLANKNPEVKEKHLVLTFTKFKGDCQIEEAIFTNFEQTTGSKSNVIPILKTAKFTSDSGNVNDDGGNGGNTYYDLSLPCPPNHPGNS